MLWPLLGSLRDTLQCNENSPAVHNPCLPELRRCGTGVSARHGWTRALQGVCKRQLADQGKSMLHEFGALVPKMMSVLLPFMALVMLALYPSPPRLYAPAQNSPPW